MLAALIRHFHPKRCFRPDRAVRRTVCCLLLLTSFPAIALQVDSGTEQWPLTSEMRWYPDHSGELTLSDVRQPQRLGHFRDHDKPLFNLGYVDHPVWFYVPITRNPADPTDETTPSLWLGLIDYAPLDLIDIYQVRKDGSVHHRQMGDTLPFDQREYRHHKFVFPLTLDPGESVDLFIRVDTDSALQMPLTLFSPAHAMALSNDSDVGYAAYFGGLMFLVLYNLMLLVVLRERSYLFYVLHVTSFVLVEGSISGHTYEYLWPSATGWVQYSIPVLINISCLFRLLFSRSFLSLPRFAPTADRLVLALGLLVTVNGLLCFVVPYQVALFSSLISIVLTGTLTLGAGIQSLFSGFRVARFYLVASIVHLAGIHLHTFATLDILPNHPLLLHAGLIGTGIEALLLSLALADRFNLKIRSSESRARENSRKLYRANQQLNVSLQEQQRLLRVKDSFLASISHELRTPMNGVEGSLALVRTDNMPRTQKAYIAAAKQSARDMTGKIDAILRFSEMQSGELKIKREPVEIRNLLNPLVEDARNKCLLKGLEFGMHIDRNVPSVIETDADQLVHVVRQLVDNAIKFTDRGQVRVFVSTGMDEVTQHAMLCISVIDSGSGVPESLRQAVFSAFEDSSDPEPQAADGLGIGLRICRELAGLMEGELTIESTDGEGSEFTFKLPLRLPDPNLDVARLAGNQASSKVVLIAEDNPVNQMVLKGVLERIGCMTLTVTNGAQACKILEEQPVDLVLMDCQMPVMNGFEATRHIRSLATAYSNLPIIAVTANAMSMDSIRCLEAGMNDYVKKPINQTLLQSKVRYWLQSGKIATM